ncbi:MAG: hypothetical protein ABJB74_12075 [Gemmatimonas sp.]
MHRLARWYLGYSATVGGVLLLLLVVGTQAAHSGAELALAPLLGVIVPLPMLVVGLTVRREWRGAPVLCAMLPLLMMGGLAFVWGRPQPPRASGLGASFLFNAVSAQLYFLPGAIIFGIWGVVRAHRERGVAHAQVPR